MATKKTTVLAGDNLRTISKREYGNEEEFKTLIGAGIRPNRLKAGQELNIPEITPAVNPNQIGAAANKEVTNNLTPEMLAARERNQAMIDTNNSKIPSAPAVTTPIVTAPGTPSGIGDPNIGKPLAVGGKQSFEILNRLKTGVIDSGQTPVTPEEQEAFAMYENYNKYKDYTGDQLYELIKKGELTPDPTNLLWRALGENGEPTDAMIQAYAQWDKASKTGTLQDKEDDPFLGGRWQNITSVDEANDVLEDIQNNSIGDDGEVIPTRNGTSGTSEVVEVGSTEYNDYRSVIMSMMGDRPEIPEYEKRNQELRERYGMENDETELNDLDAQIADVQNSLEARVNAQRGKGNVPMGVVAGRIGEIERQENERLNVLNRSRQVLVNAMTVKQNAIGQMMDFMKADYETAKNDFNDGFSQSMETIDLFRNIEETEYQRGQDVKSEEAAAAKFEAEQIQKQQDHAKAVLQTLYNGIQDGNIDPASLTEGQELQWAELEVQAGIPVGTFLDMANKYEGLEMKGQPSEIFDEEGNRSLQFVMQDKRTGAVTIKTMSVGANYKDTLALDTARVALAKSRVDLDKSRSETYESATGYDVEGTGITVENSKYGLRVAEDGSISFSSFDGKDEKELKTLPGREQCGAFVNDALGLTGSYRVGDTIEDKKKLRATNTPTPGAVFIQEVEGKYAPNGHAGIVTKVYENGDWDYIQANGNANNDGVISTGTMKAANAKARGIYGFSNGVKTEEYYTDKVKTEDETKKLSETERKELSMKESIDFHDDTLKHIAGEDGKVGQEVYNSTKQQWIGEARDPEEFDKKFKNYINPEFYKEYNVEPTIMDDWEYWANRLERFNIEKEQREVASPSYTGVNPEKA